MLKAELHTHNKADPQDGHWVDYTAKELIDEASKKGFDVLALTCHNFVHSDPDLKSYANGKGILLIFGIERDIEGKHVLIYNITQQEADQLQTFNDLERLKKRKKKKNEKEIFVIAAHPLYPYVVCLRKKILEFPDLFDAWEHSFFHTSWYNPNKKMLRWAATLGKPIVGNADVHLLKDLGRTYTLIDAKKNEEAIFKAIKEGKVKVVTESLPLMEFLRIGVRALFSPLKRKLRKRFVKKKNN